MLERLKADGRLHRLPVVMISALQELDSVVRCIELGAEDYLPKPFNPVLLKARIGACLEKKRLRDQAAAQLERMETELGAARELQASMVPTRFPAPARTIRSRRPRSCGPRASSAATSTTTFVWPTAPPCC